MKVLGIDVGGSGIKGNLVDISTGEILSTRHRIDTPKPATPKAVSKTVGKIVTHFNWKGPIGCGFPSAIQGGIIKTAANIDKGWIGEDVESLFAAETKCQVKVVNDADAAGLAEALLGAGKGKSGVTMLLTVGTGIGSALINNGKLVPNTELGHLHFKGDIAEKYCSDSARKREDLSWTDWGKRFNKYLQHINRLFYPDRIIIGGGASKRFHKFSSEIDVPVKVLPATLLNDAGIIGAALAARELKQKK